MCALSVVCVCVLVAGGFCSSDAHFLSPSWSILPVQAPRVPLEQPQQPAHRCPTSQSFSPAFYRFRFLCQVEWLLPSFVNPNGDELPFWFMSVMVRASMPSTSVNDSRIPSHFDRYKVWATNFFCVKCNRACVATHGCVRVGNSPARRGG